MIAGRAVLVALTGQHALVHQAGQPRGEDLARDAEVAARSSSSSVTDVVVLPGGEHDRRGPQIRSLGLPVHDETWLRTLSTSPSAGRATEPGRDAALVLPRGGATDLPVTSRTAEWAVTATWEHQVTCDIDLVAVAVDGDEQVSRDEDFVFYGSTEAPGGTITLSADGPAEQSITIDTANLPAAVRKVVIAAAIDGPTTFGTVGAVEITVAPGSSEAPLAQATLDAGTTERTMLLAEVYRRGPSWRLRAIGQGYDHGLDELARGYGVDVDE